MFGDDLIEVEMRQSFSDNRRGSFVNEYTLDSNVPYRWVLFYILVANIWTLILTAVPVIFTIGPNNYYANHPNWYTGNDVLRFIEPIGGLLLNFLVVYKSGIFFKPLKGKSAICICVFLFGVAIYGQGAGFHSAANMFQNSLETIRNEGDDRYGDLYYYMRTTWEHIVSHYLYAGGLAIVHISQAWAYRNTEAPEMGLTNTGLLILVLSSITLGVLIATVMVEFPSGTIVGFIYLVLYGFGVIGGYHVYLYVIKKQYKVLEQFGHLPVLHYFLLSYILAFCLLIAWLGYAGGFKSRTEAGVNV